MPKRIISLIWVVCLFVLVGCSKWFPTGPMGPTGPAGEHGDNGLPGEGIFYEYQGTLQSSNKVLCPELAYKTYFIEIYIYAGTGWVELPSVYSYTTPQFYILNYTKAEITFINCPQSTAYKIIALVK